MTKIFTAAIVNPKQAKNVGTLHRNLYCFGGTHLIHIGGIGKGTLATDTPKTEKLLPVIELDGSVSQFKHFVAKNGLFVVGVETKDSALALGMNAEPHHCFDWAAYDRIIFLFGNESMGLSKDWLNLCDMVVYIPMARPGSLNVGVASGIIMAGR